MRVGGSFEVVESSGSSVYARCVGVRLRAGLAVARACAAQPLLLDIFLNGRIDARLDPLYKCQRRSKNGQRACKGFWVKVLTFWFW